MEISVIRRFVTESGLEVRVVREAPEHADALVDLFQHMSPGSRYQRFNEMLVDPDPNLVKQEATRLATMVAPVGGGWLAFADLPDQANAPIAAAHYVQVDANTAEVSVSVRDDLQGNGVGHKFLLCLVDPLREAGIQRIVATFNANNRAVWGLVRHLPFETQVRVQGGEVRLEADLTRPREADGKASLAVEGRDDQR